MSRVRLRLIQVLGEEIDVHKVRRALGALIAVSVLLAATPGAATAHQFNGPYTDALPVSFASDESNTDHHLYWNHFAVWQQRLYDQQTDLTVAEVPRQQWTNWTDIVWFATPDVAPNLGDYSCRLYTAGRCDRSRVRFREDLTRTIDQFVALHLVCHEFGHAYGFGHLAVVGSEPPTCMEPIWTYNPQFAYNISPDMVRHINELY